MVDHPPKSLQGRKKAITTIETVIRRESHLKNLREREEKTSDRKGVWDDRPFVTKLYERKTVTVC